MSELDAVAEANGRYPSRVRDEVAGAFIAGARWAEQQTREKIALDIEALAIDYDWTGLGHGALTTAARIARTGA